MHHADRNDACLQGRCGIAGSTGGSAKFNSIMESENGSKETQGGEEGRREEVRKEGRTQGRKEGRREESEEAPLAVCQPLAG